FSTSATIAGSVTGSASCEAAGAASESAAHPSATRNVRTDFMAYPPFTRSGRTSIPERGIARPARSRRSLPAARPGGLDPRAHLRGRQPAGTEMGRGVGHRVERLGLAPAHAHLGVVRDVLAMLRRIRREVARLVAALVAPR